MTPAASVSGVYSSHPQAKYFNVGRISRDQVASYAQRKGMPVEEVERWLASNLAYDPTTVPVQGRPLRAPVWAGLAPAPHPAR